MATSLSVADRTITERTTLFYNATLKDHQATPVVLALASVNSITLTLRDKASGVKILDAVDVKNANGGTLHATSGAFEYEFTPAQNSIVNENIREGDSETHIATFTVVYSNTRELNHVVPIIVEQLADV